MLLTKNRLKKSFVLQHDQSDCGVACLLSVIHYYNGTNSLENLRKFTGTTRQGTTLLGLYQAANKLGFYVQGNQADINALMKHQEPLILHVILEKQLQHYLVCYGFENNRFILGDPAKGIVSYSKEELINVWKSKSCLTLKPNKYFIEVKAIRKNKKQWFLKLLKEDYKLIGFSVLLGLGIAILGMAMAVFFAKIN
ncbi:MAG: cysteine peptidase family C39 domain-containing protein [Flavobacteriaceae bacterium]|nr:cysteine peptidase family C39 domain-containing protein [Flavobacteriaceae bacterium]